MAITSIANKPAAGIMADGKAEIFTLTTTGDDYEVIGAVNVTGLPGVQNCLDVTTKDLLFKFEYSRDGTHWYTAIEDFPVAAAAHAELTAVRNMQLYRVSVKPAAAGQNGTIVWTLICTKTITPPEYRAAFAYETVTVTSAHAEPLTLATFDGAFRANISVESNPIRVRWDGTAPTATEGHLMQSGDTMTLDFTADIWHFKAIATGGDCKLRVTYSR